METVRRSVVARGSGGRGKEHGERRGFLGQCSYSIKYSRSGRVINLSEPKECTTHNELECKLQTLVHNNVVAVKGYTVSAGSLVPTTP